MHDRRRDHNPRLTLTSRRWRRETIRDVGYTQADFGFNCHTCAVISSIDEQSPDIAMGVDPGGAGDQGMMFGYACNETDELMPASDQPGAQAGP